MLRGFRPFFTILSLCGMGTALASPPHSRVRDCNQFFGTLQAAKVDSSVEIELGANTPTMNLFDTTDGTLAPVLGGADIPERLASQLRAAYPEVADLKTLPWDSLDSASQVALIQQGAHMSRQDFFANRKVPGLRYRDVIELNFAQKTEFLGREYPAGKHRFKSSEIFRGTAIEFRGPESMSTNLGFELHMRSPDAPSATLKNAWALERGLNYTPGNLHQHVVAKVPQAKLDANPLLQATRMTEYYRRINLYAEMKNLLHGGAITRNAKGNIDYFGNMSDKTVASVFDYFATGAEKNLGSTNKIAWVGMRGSDAYSGSEKIWGLEFRDLAPGYAPNELGRMLDATQSALVRDDYGIPEEKIQRWLKRKGGETRIAQNFGWLLKFRWGGAAHLRETHKQASVKLKYPEQIQNTQKLYSSLSTDLRKILNLSDAQQAQLSQSLKIAHEQNLGVAMLVKDWAQDPLFFENPEVVKKIHEVQAQALRRLMAGEKQKDVMPYFLKRSGIYYMFEKSLGI